jgi:hypothetical protein
LPFKDRRWSVVASGAGFTVTVIEEKTKIEIKKMKGAGQSGRIKRR